MRDNDIAHCSYPGGVAAAENHGMPGLKGGAMNEHGGLPKGDGPVAHKKIGKKHGKVESKKEMKAEEKHGFGKKIHGK